MGERTYREMPVEVCPECQGQWMDHTTLEHILNRLAAWRRSKSLDSHPYGLDTGHGFLWFLSELFR